MATLDTLWNSEALQQRRPSDAFYMARELLGDSSRWTQGARARDVEGLPVFPHSPRATRWSMNGALAVVSNPWGITPPRLLQTLDRIARECQLVSVLCRYEVGGIRWDLWESADDFNDQRPHNYILRLLELAAQDAATLESVSTVEDEARQASVG